jgi:ABC-2 type transport system permease protein
VRIFSIAWKDFKHTYRDLAALATMLLAPLLLAGALGAAFGSGDQFAISPIQTVIADEDRGMAATYVLEAFTSSELADIFRIEQTTAIEEAREAVDRGEADVAVILPAGLTQAVMAGEGMESTITVYSDPILTVAPAITSSVVRTLAESFNGARAAAGASVGVVASTGFLDQDRLTAVAAAAATDFSQTIRSSPPVALQATSPLVPGAEERPKTSVGGEVLLGMMIFFTLFGALMPAGSILEEHEAGTLSRLFTTPAGRSTILAGKYVAVFCVVLVQTAILLVIGRFFLGAHWGKIGPVIALTVCGAFMASSLGLLTVSFAKTRAQSGAVSSAVFVFLGMMGGSFTGGLSTSLPTRRFTPNGWLLEGWSRIVYGGSWGDICLHIAVTLGFAAVFFVLATWFFRRRYT